MKGYIDNIGHAATNNGNFRRVIYTAKHSQLVLMSLKPGEDIGEEIHDLDQFFRVEVGEGKAIMNGVEYPIGNGSAVLVPEGVKHNIINTGNNDLKLYTIYSPPNHKDGIVHQTRAVADADMNDHFEGITSK